VWYTPEPVVSFIVRAVDDILKTQFKLPQGLADTSKTKVTIEATEAGSKGKLVKRELELHRVQILDPATGTGTFLAQTIRHIYDSQFSSMQGVWSEYVKKDLIPRLNGFEILMTSYAMAHLKLDMLLTETGYKPEGNAERLRVYLTNSLEEHHPDTGTLFAGWLSTEANEANHIKRDAPVMVVMGNPPYSVSSSNKSDWIQDLLKDYKKDLNERKINLDDDYIKFIRFGQHFVEKNGEGVLAYISNNSFIDGITHRQMRKNLLESFDEIYILDLHGSAMKQEIAPDGSKDENVFDIMQGVSINLFIKTGKKEKNALGRVFHAELYGKREAKYTSLHESTINNLPWVELNLKAPVYFFVNKNFSGEDVYKKGFRLDDLMSKYVSGFQTKRDKVTISFSEKEMIDIKNTFLNSESAEIRNQFQLPDDGRDWTIDWAKNDLTVNNPVLTKVMYRPFDERFTFYTGKSKGFVAYPRDEMFRYLNKSNNFSIITCRQQSTFDFQHVFISRLVSDMCNISSQTKETGYIFPLYIYPDSTDFLADITRTPNFNTQIISAIAKDLQLNFTPEKTNIVSDFAPIDLLDYIYAVLHSPTYRETYKEFLKIDFPRVPYPKNVTQFWQLVGLGCELRQLHLLEGSVINQCITRYPQSGSNLVDKLQYEDGKVYINDTQYFEGVPQIAWEFYIGGYQPAQKWLKSRKGRTLGHEDISHYQKIIKAMVETDRLMQVIDKIDII
jgi:predicted helicase